MVFYASVFGLISIIFSMLNAEEMQTKKYVGQEIFASFRNGLIASLIGILIVAGLKQFESVIDFGATFFSALMLFIPLLFFLWFGGLAFVQHLCLRIALKRKIPVDVSQLEAFIKLGSERFLTFQVGSGWGFFHRYLLEYFAALHPDAQPPAGSV